jgi:hypothetical protein
MMMVSSFLLMVSTMSLGKDTWFAGSAIVNGQRLGPPLGIRSLAANSNGSVLYANVHVGGIPRFLDGGRTWQPTIDIDSDVHEVCAHPADPNILAAASAVGLCISHDVHAPSCYAVAFSADDIFVSAAAGPFAAQGRIYRRPIRQEATIVAAEGGLPTWTNGKTDTGCTASNGSRVALVDSAGILYLSTEFGRAWSRSRSQLPTPSSVLLC